MYADHGSDADVGERDAHDGHDCGARVEPHYTRKNFVARKDHRDAGVVEEDACDR